MDLLIQDTLSFLLLYKYAALFLVTFFAAFALPLPSTVSLMTAAGFASQGYLNIGWVVFWATLANVAADNLAYWVTRLWGDAFFETMGIHVKRSPVFTWISTHLHEHSNAVIFWSRFEVILTITVNVLSGIVKSDYRKFFLFGLFGEAAQTMLFSAVGYFFGSNLVGEVSLVEQRIAAVLLFLLGVTILFRKRLFSLVMVRAKHS